MTIDNGVPASPSGSHGFTTEPQASPPSGLYGRTWRVGWLGVESKKNGERCLMFIPQNIRSGPEWITFHGDPRREDDKSLDEDLSPHLSHKVEVICSFDRYGQLFSTPSNVRPAQ